MRSRPVAAVRHPSSTRYAFQARSIPTLPRLPSARFSTEPITVASPLPAIDTDKPETAVPHSCSKWNCLCGTSK